MVKIWELKKLFVDQKKNTRYFLQLQLNSGSASLVQKWLPNFKIEGSKETKEISRQREIKPSLQTQSSFKIDYGQSLEIFFYISMKQDLLDPMLSRFISDIL